MTDPRKDPQWKQMRHEQRLILLLGAILDSLTKPAVSVAPTPPPATTPTTTRTRKTNA